MRRTPEAREENSHGRLRAALLLIAFMGLSNASVVADSLLTDSLLPVNAEVAVEPASLIVDASPTPYGRYAGLARSRFSREISRADEGRDLDSEAISQLLLTGPLSEHSARVDSSGQVALFSPTSHEGIFRTLFVFASRLVQNPLGYESEELTCPGGGSVSIDKTSNTKPAEWARGSPTVQYQLKFSDCHLYEQRAWLEQKTINHADEYYERAGYTGLLLITADYQAGDVTQAYYAYDELRAVAGPDSLTLTGVQDLGNPSRCEDASPRVSTVLLTRPDGDSVLYSEFVSALIGAEKDDDVCGYVHRPANFLSGEVISSQHGEFSITPSGLLSHRLDLRTLEPIPLESVVRDSGTGSVQVSLNNRALMEISFAPPTGDEKPGSGQHRPQLLVTDVGQSAR